MSTSQRQKHPASKCTINTIRGNIDHLHENLPHPDEGTWTNANDKLGNNQIQRYVRAGIVRRANRIQRPNHTEHQWEYETNPAAYQTLQQLKAARTQEWPCGHTGLINLQDGDYTCGYQDCHAEYTRRQATEDYWNDSV